MVAKSNGYCHFLVIQLFRHCDFLFQLFHPPVHNCGSKDQLTHHEAEQISTALLPVLTSNVLEAARSD